MAVNIHSMWAPVAVTWHKTRWLRFSPSPFSEVMSNRQQQSSLGFAPLKGRGARFAISLGDGPAEIIDESYNANPGSMRAALSLLGAARPGAGGRRIAVLGDMLELGADSGAFHAGLASPVEDAHADLVFACGSDMRALYDALPVSRRGAWGATSSDIAPDVVRTSRAGDVILVKGSLGSRMAVVLDALKAAGRAV